MSPVLSRPGRGGAPLTAMRELAEATSSGPAQPLRSSAWWRRQVVEATPELTQLLELIERRYGDQPVAHAASHGDWTEWNSGRLADGRTGVWDWERYALDIPVGLDLGHWLVQGSLPHRLTGWEAAATVSLPNLRRSLPDLGVPAEQAELLLQLYLVNLHVRYTAESEGFNGRRVRLVAEALLAELKREVGVR
jgi:hypothetical protein